MHTQHKLQLLSKDQMIIIKKRQRAPSPPAFANPTSTSIDSATTSSSTTTTTPFESIEEEQDMVNCLILLAQGTHHVSPDRNINHKRSTNPRVFRCKTCNKCFPSFQSLGGHRTSHRKPKHYATHVEALTATSVRDSIDLTTTTTLSLKPPTRVNDFTIATRVHRCSTCYAEFSSGQALGGHMRRHRNVVNVSSATSISGDAGGSLEYHGPKKPLNLDLNIPAPEEDQGESRFSFLQPQNVIVFSSSLVNCNY
ncbi:hypothetical protein LR48_Vigan02g096200 [Vigna angularis]|uniref:Zinc finger protein n=2 Tax=Phaseolus angularis TaxID=3914 RepID=A0A0L9TWL2_PHAAN|nr:zinc finger protein ZAT5 [Vigna angularis]KAG2402998.1 Zinc finger protein [Vigna angularis]KOM34812.1 hypothetical protein LR48_Vigan02g096200 [Vigna angularis]BAT95802.1 hypothetical protein VIGAN_08260900 [Vigna angularis var. angularis]